jgi:hypothetical protein
MAGDASNYQMPTYSDPDGDTIHVVMVSAPNWVSLNGDIFGFNPSPGVNPGDYTV